MLSLDIGAIWSSVWPYLLAIMLFGVIIGIHEFGHFFFAKLFKVKVNEFSLGMGPQILKKKKGELKAPIKSQSPDALASVGGVWSCYPDSDRGPHPYQGCALPAEP